MSAVEYTKMLDLIRLKICDYVIQQWVYTSVSNILLRKCYYLYSYCVLTEHRTFRYFLNVFRYICTSFTSSALVLKLKGKLRFCRVLS